MKTRRGILQLAAGASLSFLPRAARAQFPPQQTIDNDPLRPRYHLMPARGWMNDPCAPVFYKGLYHLFFQYNPGASVWGDMHWAHAVSPDMVHWQPRAVAIAPTPGFPDESGVFTGSVVLDNGKPVIIYTGISKSSPEQATLWNSHPPMRESQMLATPVDDSLDRWAKRRDPVIAAPPRGMKVTGFRDPTIFRASDRWFLLLASGEKSKGGNVLLYESQDLRNWRFHSIFAKGEPTGKVTDDTVDSGETWECPDFFPLSDKWVLIHSTGTPDGRLTLWQSGTLDPSTLKWNPETQGVLNHGSYYAPKTQLDADGNRILWGWIPETRPQAEFAKAGWAGCMSLPRVLTLQDGQLRFKPAKQVASLRSASGTSLDQNETIVSVSRKPGGVTNFSGTALMLESGGSSFLLNGKELPHGVALPPEFEIRCFFDHSVLEVFVGDRAVITDRIYDKSQKTRIQLPAGYTLTEKAAYRLNSI